MESDDKSYDTSSFYGPNSYLYGDYSNSADATDFGHIRDLFEESDVRILISPSEQVGPVLAEIINGK